MFCRKIMTCLVSILFITSALFVIVNVKNENVIVAGSSGSQGNGNIGLNYSYMWKITENLSNIAHRYQPGEIPKGRAFGSKGCEEMARDLIYREMTQNLTLSNVIKDKLGPSVARKFISPLLAHAIP